MDMRPAYYALCASVVLAFNVDAENLYSEWAQKNATNLNSQRVADDNYCEAINIQSAAMNASTPATLDEILQSPDWVIQPIEKSIWHNLREGLVTDTLDQRLQIAVMSVYEFKHKPRNEWKYLDPTWPNVKFTEKNGHREAVYNLKTRKKVDSGINQGTANFGSNPISGAHVFDIVNWIKCSTPTERQSALGKILAANPEFINASDEVMDKIADVFNLDPLGLRRKQLQLRTGKNNLNNSMDIDQRSVAIHNLNLGDPHEDGCKYNQPGGMENMNAKNIIPPKDSRLMGFDISGLKRAEGCNACKCKHETGNLKPQIWRNGLDDGYSIVVLCAECMAVKYSATVEDKKTKERKICSCASPDVFFAGVCRKKIGVLDKLWAQHYCRKCGGFRRGDMMDLIKTDKGVSVYPAGVVPSDWDGKVYEESELDEHVKSMVK